AQTPFLPTPGPVTLKRFLGGAPSGTEHTFVRRHDLPAPAPADVDAGGPISPAQIRARPRACDNPALLYKQRRDHGRIAELPHAHGVCTVEGVGKLSGRVYAQHVVSIEDSTGCRDEEVLWGQQLREGCRVARQYGGLKAVVRGAHGLFIRPSVGRALSGEASRRASREHHERGAEQK